MRPSVIARVLVHHPVAARLDIAVASCGGRAEEGGILIGAYRSGGLEITGLTEATGTDERSLTRFVRQDPCHQAAAIAAWEASGGVVTMVGEWHTHPFGEPQPSQTDLATWRGVVHRKHPTAFIIAAPGQWRLFLGKKRLAWMTFQRLEPVEHGAIGLVLRSPA